MGKYYYVYILKSLKDRKNYTEAYEAWKQDLENQYQLTL